MIARQTGKPVAFDIAVAMAAAVIQRKSVGRKSRKKRYPQYSERLPKRMSKESLVTCTLMATSAGFKATSENAKNLVLSDSSTSPRKRRTTKSVRMPATALTIWPIKITCGDTGNS